MYKKNKLSLLETLEDSMVSHARHNTPIAKLQVFFIFYEVALLELETRARRTGRETSDCNSRERLGRALNVLFGGKQATLTLCHLAGLQTTHSLQHYLV